MSYQTINQQPPNQTSLGFAPNVAAIFSYIWIPVTGIVVLLTEKHNHTVRFHAVQSLFLGAAFCLASAAISVLTEILMTVAGLLSPYGELAVALISLPVWGVFLLIMLVVWILCLVKAYGGGIYELPLIGKYAFHVSRP